MADDARKGLLDQLLCRDEAKHHRKLVATRETAEAVLDRLFDGLVEKPLKLLVARGMYSPLPNTAWRYIVIVPSAKPVELTSAWMKKTEHGTLIRALAEQVDVVVGQCDAMYSTPWNLAWFVDEEGRFGLWTPEERLLAVSGGHVLMTNRNGKSEASDISTVIGWLSRDWTQREVRLRFKGGEEVRVTRQVDRQPLDDPTYDGLDLSCDAAWLVEVTRSIAVALGVPFELHPDLR